MPESAGDPGGVTSCFGRSVSCVEVVDVDAEATLEALNALAGRRLSMVQVGPDCCVVIGGRQRSSGIHTASSSPFHNSDASARASSLSVFARAFRDPRVIRTDHDHAIHIRLKQPGDLPATAAQLERHPIARQQALRQRHDPFRRARYPASRASHTVLADRDHTESRCTSRPIARPTHLTNDANAFTSLGSYDGRTSGTPT
jgi:hypothetical protein